MRGQTALMNFKIAASRTKKSLFWQYDESKSFNASAYKNITFDKFLNVMNEYYLITYSASLSRNAWLLFSWLRVVSYDSGFFQDSYDGFMEKFCRYGGQRISKPTFFKAINELVEQELIVCVHTTDKNLKGANVYCIVDKTYIVYKLCDIIDGSDSGSMSVFDALTIMESRKVNTLFDIETCTPSDEKPKKRKPLSDDKKYNLLMNTLFKPIKAEVEEFFEFVGSYNKSGRIAMSRKLKILITLKHYLEEEFPLEDFVEAFNVTMKNTLRGNNPYRERYMFKVLDNMYVYEYEETDNTVAEELSKKAEQKLQESYKKQSGSVPINHSGITKEDFIAEKGRLMRIENYFQQVVDQYKKYPPVNKYESKLNQIAMAIKKKFDSYVRNADATANRISCMRAMDCFEVVGYDSMWNRVLSWQNDMDEPIPKEKALAIFAKSGMDCSFSKYDILL